MKRYRKEAGTDAVDRLFADAASTFVISRLGIVETISALALKVRTGELTLDDYALSRKKFLGDVGQKSFRVVRLLVAHYRYAEQLVDRHAPTRRFRTLDALQLSTAAELRRQGHADAFVCADQPLCDVAASEGLAVLNPLTQP